MNTKVLVDGNGTKYRICEVEFYYMNKKEGHEDTFTHCDPIQGKTNGKWYMHRMSAEKPMSFKAGTYKGVDISFGATAGEERFGGILLRAMLNIET